MGPMVQREREQEIGEMVGFSDDTGDGERRHGKVGQRPKWIRVSMGMGGDDGSRGSEGV